MLLIATRRLPPPHAEVGAGDELEIVAVGASNERVETAEEAARRVRVCIVRRIKNSLVNCENAIIKLKNAFIILKCT